MNDRPRHSGRVQRPSASLDVAVSLEDVSAQMTALQVTTGQLAAGMGHLAERVQGSEQRTGYRLEALEGAVSGLTSEVQALRTTQVTDTAPRLLAVEQRTLAQRAGGLVGAGLKVGSYGTLAAVIARAASKAVAHQWPWAAEAVESFLKAFDL